MRMTGRAREVSTESGLRLVRRRPRPAMVAEFVSAMVSSDTGGLLVMVGTVDGTAGQGQEHVVEAGAVDGEGGHRPAGGVDLVQQGLTSAALPSVATPTVRRPGSRWTTRSPRRRWASANAR